MSCDLWLDLSHHTQEWFPDRRANATGTFLSWPWLTGMRSRVSQGSLLAQHLSSLQENEKKVNILIVNFE